MARESQRLQIGLIICIMLIVILLTTTFFGVRSANEYSSQLRAKNEELSQAQQAQRNSSNAMQYLKYMLGSGETTPEALEAAGLQLDEEMTTIKTQFEQDMKAYGEGMDAGTARNYRTVAANLVNVVRANNEQLANLQEQVNRVLAEREQRVGEFTQRAEAAEAGQKKAEADMQAVREAFNQEREKYLAQTQQDSAQIEELNRRVAQLEAGSRRQEQTQAQRTSEFENRINLLNLKIQDIQQDTFDVPDGRVVSVNQNQRTVWLNLGLADGLREQVTFSVYDMGISGIHPSDRKARLEVTRVLDQHLSEARIVEDSLRNPIVRGDVVYSPTWRPGMKVRFALAGVMDLNNDGRSDRDLIRNVITMSGGVIDAELHDDGKKVGEMSVGTRYLVVGDRPDESANPELLAAFSEMMNDANRYGVELMKLGDLLGLMGWKPEIRTVEFGDLGQPIVNESDRFRRRTPPQPETRGTNGGAF
jgi:hypothetical protein